MLTTSAHSVPSGSDRSGQPAWRRLVAVVLTALLSPVPVLFAFWADANSDGQPDSWVDPLSGHVFTLAELDAFSDDIDGDGLSNAQEMAIGTNPFSPDTDGDGISDLLDPVPLSASNLSPANGIVWGAIALDDADGDGTPNFLDEFPYGQYGDQLGSPDTDGDGIPDFIDPAPWDYSNWSPVNGLQWLGDALADADGDGVPNFHDWYPYDSALWDPLQDPDGDGFVKAKDPRPAYPYNLSPVNGVNWGTEVYGDSDADGIANFYDAYPYDSGNGYVPSEPDADGDGIPDSSDPSPWDHDNYSAANGVSWQGDVRGDADGDGISNFYDQFPYDFYNGSIPMFDQDGDGIPDGEDPAPSAHTNLSPINGGLWYTAALADADGDGNPNFTDPWPYDPTNGNLPPEWNSPTADTDADGIPNAQDPALADPLNFSIYNGTSWYADAIGDFDADGIINFQDSYPYDYYNGSYAGPDSDGDGMTDSSDPYPNDPNNGNGDADGDGIVDSQDSYPYDATNGSGGTGGGGDPQPEPESDFDNDGIPDSSDPAQGDSANSSPINGYSWYGDVRGDADGDGVQNFWDLEPYGPPPADTDADGLIDSVDPAPDDPRNLSPHNGREWLSDALGDFDGDGVPNFFDAWPDDSTNGVVDSDGDGVPDGTDPAQWDSTNLSPYNGVSWGASALGDDDADGIPNYFDEWPQDRFNGADADMDGIPDPSDPAPQDSMNFSPHNGRNWYGSEVLGDVDNDGILNFFDLYPEDFYNGIPPVTDGGSGGNDGGGSGSGDGSGGSTGGSGGAGETPRTLSPYNYMEWGDDASDDADLDGWLNFYDPLPFDGYHRPPDWVDLPSASASPLVLLNDGYEELGEAPALGVTPARDLDDLGLAIKAGPRAGKMAISKLTALNLSLPADYVNAGGSVTFTQSGAGLIRLHAVRMVDGEGVEDREISMGVSYVPPNDGTWVHLIESVRGGGVTLTCHFPWMLYGEITGEHPSGVMSSEVEIVLPLLSVEVNCPELYMFSGHKNDVVELCKVSGITCEWKLKSATPAIGTFDHPTDTACNFTATAEGKNTIQLVIGGNVVWEKPTEIIKIIPRATWGAYAADKAKLMTTPVLNGITFHHSSNTADGAAEVLRIQDMHMQKSMIYWRRPGDGWGDIGYHFLMDKAGNVYQGRELEAAPGVIDGPYTLGSHVENNNTAAGIGICILGDYEGTEAFPAARQEALEKALSAIARRHKLTSSKVSYHQSLATTNPTECPGSNVIPKAPDIIKNVGRNLQ